jgi:ribosome biogenesis GTPase
MNLSYLGWNEFFANSFHQVYSSETFVPARVTLEHKHAYTLLVSEGELAASCTGKLLHGAINRSDLPAVGDWVAIRIRRGELHADIHAVLQRKTKFSRGAVGEPGAEQIIAANIDTVFLVTALDQNYNLRRIERYLALAWESGAQPVVVLNKSDLHADPAAARNEVESVALGAPVVALSALEGDGIADLQPWLVTGQTLALLGSSGVGKSTLINRILGSERQLTSSMSDKVGKGRHTTTRRELLIAPSGVLVIDTPGMRELQLWETSSTSLDTTFADVAGLVARCRFTNCTHRSEPGCAIRSALEEGTLGVDRWDSFQKLQREQAYAARKADSRLQRETKLQWKKLNKAARQQLRFKHDDA